MKTIIEKIDNPNRPLYRPKEWTRDDVWSLIMEGRQEICAIHSGNEAHKRLIVAAPMLFNALTELANYLEEIAKEDGWDDVLPEVREFTKARKLLKEVTA
jgi:hypothetical protein